MQQNRIPARNALSHHNAVGLVNQIYLYIVVIIDNIACSSDDNGGNRKYQQPPVGNSAATNHEEGGEILCQTNNEQIPEPGETQESVKCKSATGFPDHDDKSRH